MRYLVSSWLSLLLGSVGVFAVCSGDTLSHESVVRAVGAFTNMRYTEEHAYGYSVHLWLSGDRMLGLFMASDGLAGDTPTGLLDMVRYNQKTGSLAFQARLTLGVFADSEHRGVPSRDFYDFSGVLHGSSIRGLLRHTNALTPQARPVEEKITLQRSRTEGETMIRAATFGEWWSKVEEILKVRGPKW